MLNVFSDLCFPMESLTLVSVGVEDLLPKVPFQAVWYGKLLPAKLECLTQVVNRVIKKQPEGWE